MTTVVDSPIFEFPIRVYYEDTDAGGVVYHSIYLNYMERARTEWLLARAINLNSYAEKFDKMFVVKSLSADYKKPAHLCDSLITRTSISRLTATRVYFKQQVMRGEELLVEAIIELVCLDTKTRKPIILPPIFS